jgi:hypothetical protein
VDIVPDRFAGHKEKSWNQTRSFHSEGWSAFLND